MPNLLARKCKPKSASFARFTEVYYFDGRSKKFFSSKSALTGDIELYDMVGLTMLSPSLETVHNRMADLDSEHSEIVEIPRLNVQDKVAVQLLFLSKFPGVIHEEALRLAAEKQADKFGFVLDEV